MRTLVIGGTGTVGSLVVAGLLEKGQEVVVLTRDRDKVKDLPAEVTTVIGDPEHPETLPPAFKGIDRLFFVTPLHQKETTLGMNIVEAAQKAHIRKIVYSSVIHAGDYPHIPHFVSKMPVENAIRESGIPRTILRPNNFYQNDFWFRQAVMEFNTYPQPLGGIGVSRVDVRDIADAAVNGLLSEQFDGKTYPVNGPEPLTGEGISAMYGRYLGREVGYAGDDLDAYAASMKPYLPGWLLDDFCIMYKQFQETGIVATEDEMKLQHEILGHEPRSFESFVAEVTPGWKQGNDG